MSRLFRGARDGGMTTVIYFGVHEIFYEALAIVPAIRPMFGTGLGRSHFLAALKVTCQI
jgi:hypothetical protein